MERRSWPWKRKSSDKAASEKAAAEKATSILGSAGASLDSAALPKDQDTYKKPNYVQISVESYTHLTGLEEQVKIYEEQVEKLEEYIKELDEQLSAANSEVTAKENLAKQHAKVAEDAVSGWEKAEAEAIAFQSHLDSVTLAKLTAEDRANHLDGALKECLRQIRNLKEEHEKDLQGVVASKTRQWEKIKQELEAKIVKLDQELLRSAAENAAVSRSLQERSNMLIKLNDEKMKAETEIEILKSNIESYEREIGTLKYEVHLISKELEIRNEEKNMSVKSAEAANKQHMEGVKKIAKLEAECQRLRGLVRKRLPGPAALAQMKLEVDSLGGSYGESRSKRSPGKPLSHPSHISELSSDGGQNFHKENGFLTQRLLAMEEEMKMLKEALATRNSELLASRNLCAKITSKLQILETQLQRSSQDKSPPAPFIQIPVEGSFSRIVSNPPSMTSMSEDGNDDRRSCSESWATASISELSLLEKEKKPNQHNNAGNTSPLELMDDFLEMEKLASSSMESNGVISSFDVSDNKQQENVGDATAGGISQDTALADNGVPTEAEAFTTNRDSGKEQLKLAELQSRISNAFASLSGENHIKKVLEDIRNVVQDALNSMDAQSLLDNHCPDTRQYVLSHPGDAVETVQTMTADLADALSHIRDFILLLHKETLANHDPSPRSETLGSHIKNFLVILQKVVDGDSTLIDFVHKLSCVLRMTCHLKFNVQGYRASESEISSPDCIDKVALPENKVVLLDSSSDAYQNGCANGSDTASNPEVPDYANLVSGYGFHGSSCKVSSEDYENVKSEKEKLALELASCYEDMEMLKSQLQDIEASLTEVNSQLAAAQKSNSLAETQLKCMAESYRSLEARAEKLEAEINLLQAKTESLDNELQEEKRSHQDTLIRSKDLEEQLGRARSCSTGVGAACKTKQEIELTAAAERLAECQETILLLGKQLQALHPQAELTTSPAIDQAQKNDEVAAYNEARNHNANVQDADQIETNGIASPNLCRTKSYDSAVVLYNIPCSPSDSEDNLLRSPIDSQHPKHRSSLSGGSSSSSPTPERQSRGLSRFFAKGKIG